MKEWRVALIAAVCAAVVVPGLAHAQAGSVFDHLGCYQIKDPQQKAKYLADLVPLQEPIFSTASGCTVTVPAKLFCIPVQKTHVQPPAPNTVNGVSAQDYLVYQVKCPKAVVNGGAPLNVTDQFGTRPVLVGKQLLLLVPAYKQSNLCHAQTDPAAPVCGGDCTNPSQKCVQVPGATQCTCESPCGVDAAGVCGGTCPYATQACQVRPDASGTLVCTCDPFVGGCVPDAIGKCGGPCPNADETCVTESGTCKCEKPCGSTGIRMCGGLCPTSTDSCQMKPDDSGCECHPQTTTQPCGPDPLTNQCGGTCPNNLPCVQGGPVPGPGCICG
jgi:hypothetical protein